MARIYQNCLSCQREFYITDKDQEFFKRLALEHERELHLPKRCYRCRKQRREDAESEGEFTKVWVDEDGYERRSRSTEGNGETDEKA